MMVGRFTGIALLLAATSAMAQTPQPFPRAGSTQAPSSPAPAQTPPPLPPAAGAPAATQPTAPAPPNRTAGAPAVEALGVPLYPAAQFITSYDAGRGQRYYLYGTTAAFADLVTYYRTALKERGDLVFEDPPTHMFEIGRFRDETMAFPPGVTIKDWTFGGSQGYPNPNRGAQPARFPTVIMIVPPPPAAAAGR